MPDLKLHIRNFIIKSLRDSDTQEGNRLLERFLVGPQEVWQKNHDLIYSLLDTFNPAKMRADLLDYRRWTVGLTSEFDYLVEGLSENDLRKLIQLAFPMWRLRGGREGIRKILFAMTGRRILIYDYFDLRWIMADDSEDFPETMLGFIREPNLDSNLLAPRTIEPQEGFNGILKSKIIYGMPGGGSKSLFKIDDPILLTSLGFYGGERLILDSEQPDDPPQIEEDWETFSVGTIMDSSQRKLNGVNGIPWSSFLITTPSTFYKIIDIGGADGNILRTQYENGLPYSGVGPDFHNILVAPFPGGSIEAQEISIEFTLPISFPGPTFLLNTLNYFNIGALTMAGSQFAISYFTPAYNGSVWVFHLAGFYGGELFGFTPVEIPMAYILDGNPHKLTLKHDLSGTYFIVDIDDGTYQWQRPSDIKSLNLISNYGLLSFGEIRTDGINDIPNLTIKKLTAGYDDPSQANGEYTVDRVVNDNTLVLKEAIQLFGLSNIHYYLRGLYNEFNTDIHVEETVDLNKELIGQLLQLNRAPSEQFTVIYWNIIEQFTELNRFTPYPGIGSESAEIKTDAEGRSYVELIDNTTIASSFSALDDSRGYVFESKWQWSVNTARDLKGRWFFNLQSDLLETTGLNGYHISVELEESGGFFPDGLMGMILYKWEDDISAPIASIPIDIDPGPAPVNFPQLAPDIDHLIRVVVTPLIGGNKIVVSIDGTKIFDALDSSDPHPIGGLWFINNDVPTGETILKIYDFKYAELPVSTEIISREDPINNLE